METPDYIPPCESDNKAECSETNGYNEKGFNKEGNEYQIQGTNPEINTIIVSELLKRNHVDSKFIVFLLTSEGILHLNNIKLKKGDKIILESATNTQYELSIGKKTYTIDSVQNRINEM